MQGDDLESPDLSGYISLEGRRRRVASDLARLRWVRLCDMEGNPKTTFRFGEGMRVFFCFEVKHSMTVGIHAIVKSMTGEPLIFFSSLFDCLHIRARGSENIVELIVPQIPLASGRYTLDINLHIPYIQCLDYIESACHFDITMAYPGSGGYPYEARFGVGYVYIDHIWRLPETKEGLGENTKILLDERNEKNIGDS